MITARKEGNVRKLSVLRKHNFWLTLATLASLGIAVLGVFLAYFGLKQPEAKVIFETVGNTNVLDLRRPIDELNIVFRGDDIQEQSLNLRILTINVANSGEVDILPNHYDQEDEWGMKFNGGEVIEARLVGADSAYLKSKVVPQHMGVDAVVFPKVIFEKGSVFTVEVLLLHPKDESPSISTIGKIAGVGQIDVVKRPLATQEVSIFAQSFSGSVFVQIWRALIYFIISLLALILAIICLATVSELARRLSAARRKRRVSRTRTIRQIDQDDVRDFLIAQYESNGIAGIKRLRDLIREPSKIHWAIPQSQWIVPDYHLSDEGIVQTGRLDMILEFRGPKRILSDLSTLGVLQLGDSNNAVIDAKFVEVVESLLKELEN